MTINRKEMQFRRLQAGARLLKGEQQTRIARDYGVSRTTVSRWARQVLVGGLDALRAQEATGRPPRTTPEQRRDIAEMWRRGPRAYGIARLRWTNELLAECIYRMTRIRYDPDHVGRLIIHLGLRIARQRRREIVPRVNNRR